MSSPSANTKHIYATQPHTGNTGQARDQQHDHAGGHRDPPASAHDHHVQKRKETDQEDKNNKHNPTASTLTSQAVTRFEEEPRNNIQPLDVRVTEYQKSSPAPPCERKRSSSEQWRQMADSIKDWSDQWDRLERE